MLWHVVRQSSGRREEVSSRMTAVDRSLPGAGPGGEAVPPLADAPDGAAEDRALLERLRAGQDAAFGELFARHSAAVRRLAFGLVSDAAEAEDLTAEAFFRVLQAIRRGAGPVDNVRAYLLIVARRVAWEWQTRRRDVPVTDEELSNRAGADPDTAGQSTERNLITRAFTSLPERWRSVLWKVEVEGERPAVVATNFGLSANATAALARRARQGLRAAYLQAHLTVDRSGGGCRSVLEKLGAYTAGSIKGSERRRIRTHLGVCPSCATMHDELRDVCSGLRAHAGLFAAPLAALAAVKGVLAGAKAQVALVASSATVIGVLGIVGGLWGTHGSSVALDDLNGKRDLELIITGTPPPHPSTPESIALTTGWLGTSAVVPNRRRTGDPTTRTDPAAPPPNDPTGATPAAGGQDAAAPVIYRETNVAQRSESHGDYMVIYETTSVTEVNAADQTRTSTKTREYTKPATVLSESTGSTSSANPRAEDLPSNPTATTTDPVKPTTTTMPKVGKPATTDPR